MTDDDRMALFERLFAQLLAKHPYAEFSLNWSIVWGIIGYLQLALRHPGAQQREISKSVREFIRVLRDQMDAAAPGLGALVDMGDTPEHDV